jgi:hypothetical protein
MANKRKKRQIQQLICGKCGNDGIAPADISKHGPRQRDGYEDSQLGCTKAKNRPAYCPLCHEDFYNVKAVTLNVTDFKAVEEAEKAGKSVSKPIRRIVDTFRRSKWPAKRIYKHLEEHRRMGHTLEMFS